MQHLRDVTHWIRPHDAKSKPIGIHLAIYDSELWTFSTIEVAFVKYLELLNSSNKVDLVAQTFKYVTSLAFCNLIGLPKSWRTDQSGIGTGSLPDPPSACLS